MPDFSDFLEIQTQTAWGKTLQDFCGWCAPEPGNQVLDVGCGPGLLPALFASRDRVTAFGADSDLHLLIAAPVPVPLAGASVYTLPFPDSAFDMLTATNVLFLLGDPLRALCEMSRLLKPGGQLCLLNPSEALTVESATQLADARGLTGKNRESLLGWAQRAEKHVRWSEAQTRDLNKKAGLTLTETAFRVGPGFGLFSRSVKK